ncbi:DUF4886 domain-containing protein [Phragmitibacter flavus]|uniref:DUF4886 domain-containing protein n=2 Tax=Phragmitibacter flavus TaxID=2576071 RepID=A0A5R8KDF9_9BACT|nr:DUF4886 domain-containing protein [Phragmitibacter flavus]
MVGVVGPVPGVLAETAGEKNKKTVRLLTIGNSFSRDATMFLKDLVKAGGHELIHDSIVVGGASLELHATKAQKFEADANDPAGLYKDGKSLKAHLLAEKWEVVTIQQASIKSHDVDTFRPFARILFDYIKKHAPDARVVFHETWAYRSDDPRFSVKNKKVGEPLTQQAMFEGLKGAYGEVAKELGTGMIPTGNAFYLADTDAVWGYRRDEKFEVKSAKPPALPDQTHSLHVGRVWKKGKDGRLTLAMDGHHASKAGQYLGACVFYESLFGGVVEVDFAPKGLESEYAAFLRKTAQRAVEEMKP